MPIEQHIADYLENNDTNWIHPDKPIVQPSLSNGSTQASFYPQGSTWRPANDGDDGEERERPYEGYGDTPPHCRSPYAQRQPAPSPMRWNEPSEREQREEKERKDAADLPAIMEEMRLSKAKRMGQTVPPEEKAATPMVEQTQKAETRAPESAPKPAATGSFFAKILAEIDAYYGKSPGK